MGCQSSKQREVGQSQTNTTSAIHTTRTVKAVKQREHNEGNQELVDIKGVSGEGRGVIVMGGGREKDRPLACTITFDKQKTKSKPRMPKVASTMATTWEHFVNTVQNSSGNPANLYEYIQKSQEFLSRNVGNFDNVLQTLNVEHHSLAILALLAIKFTSPGGSLDSETVFIQIKEFIGVCNGEHVRYGSNLFAELCHCMTNSLVSCQQAIRGIPILCHAIRKIQQSHAQLTSIHSDLCQLCLASKCFKPALEFLDTDVTDISKENGCYDAKHFLLYYYYGGMIYTALKQYDRALYFYQVCITTPSSALSLIMLEAYKKYVLLCLILHGKILNLPKYTSRCVSKSFKQMTQPYHDLSSVYENNKPDEVRKVITQHQELYVTEENMGLVKQCLTSLYKKNIQRLTKTFITLSLANIASRVQLSNAKEAEKYLLEMIADEEIYARINQRDGMVEFYESPVKYDNLSVVKSLDMQMQQCIELDKQMCRMDRELATSTEYLRRSVGGGVGGAGGLSMVDENGLVASGPTVCTSMATSSVPTPSLSPAAGSGGGGISAVSGSHQVMGATATSSSAPSAPSSSNVG